MFVSSLFPIVSELVQQHTPTIVSYGKVLAPGRKVHRSDVAQGGTRRWPISKGSKRRKVDLSMPDLSVRQEASWIKKQRTKRI